MRVPDQLLESSDKAALAPSRQVTCTSCPQACMTGTSVPPSVTARATLAYANPVFSSTGRASMSARSRTTGPAPLRSRPTTPVPPTPTVTSKPDAESCAATSAAVRVSRNPSSGLACRSLYTAARSTAPPISRPIHGANPGGAQSVNTEHGRQPFASCGHTGPPEGSARRSGALLLRVDGRVHCVALALHTLTPSLLTVAPAYQGGYGLSAVIGYGILSSGGCGEFAGRDCSMRLHRR